MHLQKRVLITGGAGFIGGFLCEALLARGYEVLCADNCFTGTRRNIEHLERFPSDMNRDSQRGGKGGVLASDSACEANHGQTLFTGLTGTCDRSG
jgi:nucleoside-diphosphate-sugar epimerase